MPATSYLDNHVIDSAFTGKTAFTMPAVYVGLSSTTPAAAGTGVTEPSAGNYARVATTGSTWNASASGSTTNAAVITFAAASADWLAGVNLTYVVAYDALTTGNLLWYAPLTTAKAVLNGDSASFPIGTITVSMS